MVSTGVARRFPVLALIAACEAPEPPLEPPAPQWVYAPAPSGWPVGVPQARFGRAQAPQLLASLGITGPQKVPLRLATLWDVPGGGPARAVAYGYEGVQPAVELIDVDTGRVVWRETGLCTGPIVGVAENAIVCSDGVGVRGVTLDGKAAWRVEQTFVAMTDDRVVVSAEGQAVILDASSGEELTRVKLPPNVVAETVVASCGDAGRELFVAAPDRMLKRIADVKGKPALTWRVQLGAFEAIDACDGEVVVVKANGSLVSFARATGELRASVPEVRGWWPARDGSDRVEVATPGGVTSWSRDLVESRALVAAPLGELISRRGDRRLVRATASTMVVLDRDGVAAYVALGTQSAVLGDTAVVGASYTGSRANTIVRFALPPRYPRTLRVSLPSKGIAVPTELRDLPSAPMVLVVGAIAKPDTGKDRVGPVAIDPAAPNVVYTVASETPLDDETAQTVAAFDIAKKAWIWERSDACGPGVVKALAVTAQLVVCGTQGERPGTALVRATSRDGVARWEWEGDGVDTIIASKSLLLVTSGDRAYVLDENGRRRLVLATKGGALPAAFVDTQAWGPLVIAAQHGRLVARAANLDMRPIWTLGIDGVVTSVIAAGDGVLVQLEDGDAYRIAAQDGAITGVAGIGLVWYASGDLLAGLTAGGALFGEQVPVKPAVARAIHGAGHKLLAPEDPELPDLWTPIPLPPVVGAGQQLTIYEPDGGVRVRAEYEELGTATWQPRGPTGSEIVLLGSAPPGELQRLLLVDPHTGSPTRSYSLSGGEAAFSTIVNGSRVAGIMIDKPLRVILFE
ncbi:MAG: PQQ-binding-like beta-propeller repeat protein [Kofleriaceae bacterium]